MYDDQSETDMPPAFEGVLVHGADGELYFIPQDHLEPYRLSGEHKDIAVELVAQHVQAGGADTAQTATHPLTSFHIGMSPDGCICFA